MFHQNTDFKNFLITLPREQHRSPNVKLAIQVVLSIRHHDYGNFFHLLRNRCGYLYAAIMFKQVRSMRKRAIHVMSKVYRNDANGYPVSRLTKLLCFNGDEDTIATLTHYGVTCNRNSMMVEFDTNSFLNSGEKFKTVKMNIIEEKVTATRLFICRGGCKNNVSTKLSTQSITITAVPDTAVIQEQDRIFQDMLLKQQQVLLREESSKKAAISHAKQQEEMVKVRLLTKKIMKSN